MLGSLAFLLFLQLNPSTGPLDFDLARGARQLDAVKVSEAITIDGVLNESAWSQAPMASKFIQTEPREGKAATEDTEVRVLISLAGGARRQRPRDDARQLLDFDNGVHKRAGSIQQQQKPMEFQYSVQRHPPALVRFLCRIQRA